MRRTQPRVTEIIAETGLLSPLQGSNLSSPDNRGLRASRLPPATCSGPSGARSRLFHSFTDPPHMAASNSDLQPGTPFKCEESQDIQSDAVGG